MENLKKKNCINGQQQLLPIVFGIECVECLVERKSGSEIVFFYWMTVVDSMRFDEIRPTASKGDMLCFPTSPHPSASTWNRHWEKEAKVVSLPRHSERNIAVCFTKSHVTWLKRQHGSLGWQMVFIEPFRSRPQWSVRPSEEKGTTSTKFAVAADLPLD